MLKSISLRNILSFGPGGMDLPLNPINVLIGPNGCGKSNLIDCISVLQMGGTDLFDPIRNGGGFEEWRHKPSKSALPLELKTTLASDTFDLHYELALEWPDTPTHSVRERISGPTGGELLSTFNRPVTIRGKKISKLIPDRWDSILLQVAGRDDSSFAWSMRDSFRQIRLYRNWTFGRDNALRSPQTTSQKNEFVDENYRNLGMILNRLRLNANVRTTIIEELKRFAHTITGFETLVQSGTMQIFLEEGNVLTPAIRISDGTLRYLALLSILCDPNPPPLVCLEEPELGIHPDMVPDLARLIRDASTRCQLIVTTHSEILVDAFTENPESIVVCERGEHGTEMTRLPPELLAKWLEDYSLGQLWSRGHLGGNRW